MFSLPQIIKLSTTSVPEVAGKVINLGNILVEAVPHDGRYLPTAVYFHGKVSAV